MTLKRWLYQDGHPNMIARLLNRGWAILHSAGMAPNYLVTLIVTGRQSGKRISFPLVMTEVDGERYLVSMLGKEANWVRNLKAAGGKAELQHGIKENILLEEVEIDKRPLIIKSYLQIAPGARPHIPVDKDAPIQEFERIAPQIPVFKIVKQNS
jgi:hypothetical protein